MRYFGEGFILEWSLAVHLERLEFDHLENFSTIWTLELCPHEGLGDIDHAFANWAKGDVHGRLQKTAEAGGIKFSRASKTSTGSG